MYAIYGNIYCTIHIPQMLAHIPYMDPMGYVKKIFFVFRHSRVTVLS